MAVQINVTVSVRIACISWGEVVRLGGKFGGAAVEGRMCIVLQHIRHLALLSSIFLSNRMSCVAYNTIYPLQLHLRCTTSEVFKKATPLVWYGPSTTATQE